MKDMSIYEERDGLLAKVERLYGCLALYTAANTEALKAITGLYAEAEDQRAAYGFLEVEVAEQIAKVAERDATIARVKALAYEWHPFEGNGRTHWVGCYLVHADCFTIAIRAALDVPADKLTTTTEGESRHA